MAMVPGPALCAILGVLWDQGGWGLQSMGGLD